MTDVVERCSAKGCRCLAVSEGLCRTCVAGEQWKPAPVKLPKTLGWFDLDRLARTRPYPGWERYAACAGKGADMFHLEKGDAARMKAARDVCAGCPAVYACLATAMGEQSSSITEHGVWGRTSVRERRFIRKALRARELAA